ncbi:uncharacterized protein LOC121728019 [Aricia agestis]|uniref:uncharacterized protein LOC121728019 n=1 Tax=Aricia agestis TaxID=91739 RepID=UPI001C20BFD8|nr:uncharacterized protein LOC121728019 [Aricia agestis]
MSIKSQKSLNDECSEIFEKSYSVKSGSVESLSFSDDEDSLSTELLQQLTPSVMCKLRKYFKKAKPNANGIDKRVEEAVRAAAAEEGVEFPADSPRGEDLYIDHQGFIDALHEIFGSGHYAGHARSLLSCLDPLGGGRVRWSRLVARLGARDATRDKWQPAPDPTVITLKHCMRETLVRLVSISSGASFCYAAVSRGGRVALYSAEFALLHSYEIFYDRTGVKRRVKNSWITDAVYMPDVQCVSYTASDRSVTVYEASTPAHAPLHCITGLPHIPTCLAYRPALSASDSCSLVMGGERGEVARVQFRRPRAALLPQTTTDRINMYYWMELSSPALSAYVSVSSWRAHARAVRRLRCERDGTMLSCSHDPRVSMRLRRSALLPDYVYSVPRGVTCFHAVMSLRLLATGSPDAVRLWGTTGGSAHAVLSVSSPALDVAILPTLQIVIAFCANMTLHIWELYEERHLQSLRLRFPFLGALGKRVEFGVHSLHPGPPRGEPDSNPETEDDERYEISFDGGGRSSVLVSACDSVAVVSLRPPSAPPRPPPAHTLRARRPSYWDLPPDCHDVPPCRPEPPSVYPTAAGQASLTAPPLESSPASSVESPTEDKPTHDIDDLLEKAGLGDILRADFVRAAGLRHDLNAKLHDLAANMDNMRCMVSAGAPFLALRSVPLAPLPALDRLRARTDRLVRSYPDSSLGTPHSERSTPRSHARSPRSPRSPRPPRSPRSPAHNYFM